MRRIQEWWPRRRKKAGMKLIDICGMVGGYSSEEEARLVLLDCGLDPDMEIKYAYLR